jgi:hypothetical protein
MATIAILVPMCSRKCTYTSIEDTPFFNKLYPSFQKTRDEGYNYTFFIGFDDDDAFYIANKSHLETITPHVHILTGCQHAPAKAWNQLAEIAYASNQRFDYFFQIGDDVSLTKPGWTTRFIQKLSSHSNIGVVGPCNLDNYYRRVRNGKPPVIENSFVHRTHLDIFGYFFYPEIKNWFCDDWISRIYDQFFSEIQVDMECVNSIVDNRYAIVMCPNLPAYVTEGIQRILRYQHAKS